MAKRKGKKASENTPTDVFALMLGVLRDRQKEAEEQTKLVMDKLKRMNAVSRAMREYLQKLRAFKRKLIASTREAGVDICRGDDEDRAMLAELIDKHARSYEVDDLGYELCIPDRVPPVEVQDLEGLADVIDDWEQKLSSIGDDAQLASIDLQNAVQKMQQYLTMMSNLSRISHDTAMAVVR